VEQSRKSSKKQKQKIEKYWQEVKEGKIPRNKKDIPQYKNNDGLEEPLGDVNEDGNKVLKEGPGENFLDDPEKFKMPLGLRMQQLFSEKNKDYPSRPSQDVPAIISIAEFIHCQHVGAEKNIFELDVGQQQYVFEQWEKWCEWYGQHGNNKSLEYLVKFKLQEIYLELKKGKNGSNKQAVGSNNRSDLGNKSGGYGILDGIGKKITGT